MASRQAPSKDDIAAAHARADAMEKVAKLRPTLEDYVSEGVIDHMPEGKYAIPVDGKRVLQMNESANRLAAWHGDNLAESSTRKSRREARAETLARKNHRPRVMFVVPEMPWKRRRRKKEAE